MSLNSSQIKFMNQAIESSKLVNSKFGIIVGGQAAQSCLESGWGNKVPDFNCFGIKKHTCPYTSGEQIIPTHEDIHGVLELENLEFAAYNSLDDCFMCHALVLQKNFPVAFSAKNFTDYVHSLEKDPVTHMSYATDESYLDLLTSIYNTHFKDLDGI